MRTYSDQDLKLSQKKTGWDYLVRDGYRILFSKHEENFIYFAETATLLSQITQIQGKTMELCELTFFYQLLVLQKSSYLIISVKGF